MLFRILKIKLWTLRNRLRKTGDSTPVSRKQNDLIIENCQLTLNKKQLITELGGES